MWLPVGWVSWLGDFCAFYSFVGFAGCVLFVTLCGLFTLFSGLMIGVLVFWGFGWYDVWCVVRLVW